MKRFLFLALLITGCGDQGGRFQAPCSNEGCVPAAPHVGSALCRSSCAEGFACQTLTDQARFGTCMRTCADVNDCQDNYYPQTVPKCDTKLDINDVAPLGWCVDLPKVTQ